MKGQNYTSINSNEISTEIRYVIFEQQTQSGTKPSTGCMFPWNTQATFGQINEIRQGKNISKILWIV